MCVWCSVVVVVSGGMLFCVHWWRWGCQVETVSVPPSLPPSPSLSCSHLTNIDITHWATVCPVECRHSSDSNSLSEHFNIHYIDKNVITGQNIAHNPHLRSMCLTWTLSFLPCLTRNLRKVSFIELLVPCPCFIVKCVCVWGEKVSKFEYIMTFKGIYFWGVRYD